MHNLIGTIVIDLESDKVWSSDFSQYLVDGEILVRKKGKRDLICFFKYLHFKRRVSRTNTDDFDLVFKFRIIFYHLIHFIYSGRILLAVGAIHAKNLNHYHLRPAL